MERRIRRKKRRTGIGMGSYGMAEVSVASLYLKIE